MMRPGACIECGGGERLVQLAHDEVSICLDCVTAHLAGCVPDRVSRGGRWPVYWFTCVCGRQVRDGRFTVDIGRCEPITPGELQRIERYRRTVAGIASGGVMLCRWCALRAGAPLLAPAPARVSGSSRR